MKATTTTGKASAPPRLRLKLSNVADVRREAARLYREGRSGQRPIADVSKLANVLFILHRIIEGGEIERRIDALESSKTENQE